MRYSLYVSAALIRKGDRNPGSIPRVSAPEIEQAVIKALKDRFPHHAGDVDIRSFIETHVGRIVVAKDQLRIELSSPTSEDDSTAAPLASQIPGNDDHHIIVPWSPTNRRPHIEIDDRSITAGEKPDPALVQAIARAHRWIQQLTDEAHALIEQLAAKVEIHPKVLRKTIRLAFLSPELTAMILNGGQPPSMTIATLQDVAVLSWSEQKRLVNRGTYSYLIARI